MNTPDHEPDDEISLNKIGDNPMGEAYQELLDREELLGDVTTRAINRFYFTGFNAYLDACAGEVIIRELDSVLENPSQASAVLDKIVIRPAFEALRAFYAEHFGDPDEFEEAFNNFLIEIHFGDMRSSLSQTCYLQRCFELTASE